MYKRKISNLICLLPFILLLSTACSNLSVVSKYDTDNPAPVKVKVNTYFWGLKQAKDIQTGPSCPSICIVTAKTSFGSVFIAAITLGIVVPATLEYQCCPVEPAPGII